METSLQRTEQCDMSYQETDAQNRYIIYMYIHVYVKDCVGYYMYGAVLYMQLDVQLQNRRKQSEHLTRKKLLPN